MIWVIIAISMVILEMITFTFFLLWLGVGALVAGIIALLLPEAYFLQIMVAAIVSFLCIYLIRPLVRESWQGKQGFQDAFETIVGRTGEVMEAIPKESLGIVKIGTETWSARAPYPIAKGEFIIVITRHSTIIEVELRKDV